MWRTSGSVILCFACSLLAPTGAQGQPLQLERLRTLTFNIPTERIIALEDMDGDGLLDAVFFARDPATLWIAEEEGDELVVRFVATDSSSRWRTTLVYDVDQDGVPELLIGHRSDSTLRVWESDGDDSYSLRYSRHFSPFIEGVRAGDSDGDGRQEFLVPRENFPTRLHILEAVADDTYVEEAVLGGAGGNMTLAGVRDLDGDTLPELVFSDDRYSSIERVWVFENRSLVFTAPDARLEVASLGDTDGNGLGEILGFDSITQFGPLADRRLRILESTGSGDGFVQVYNQLADGYSPMVLDVDGDRVDEMWRSLDDDSGHRTIFTLAHRVGSTLVDYYQSGDLLHEFDSDITTIITVDDNDPRGPLTVVQQGSFVHLLRPQGVPATEIPGLTRAAMLLLAVILGAFGVTRLSW